MIKHPSVQATVGKGARTYLTEEKVVKDRKIDTFTKIFGQKVVVLYATDCCSYYKLSFIHLDIFMSGYFQIFTKDRCHLQQGHLLAILYALQTSMMYMLAYFDFCLTWGPSIT